MIRDTGTVIWKELKEWVVRGGRRTRLQLGIFALVFGVLLPLQGGRGWIETPVSLVSWAWLPFLLVTGCIADAVAGERERHTLETLLATRLSDSAVFLGKAAAAVIYGCGQVWLIALVAVAAVNIGFRGEGLLFYPPAILAGVVAFPLLIAGLAAGVGMLVSLRAGSAREAQQAVSAAVILLLLPFLAVNLLPAGVKGWIGERLAGADLTFVPAGLAVVLAAVDAVLLLAARRRFTRCEIAV